jgi:hypothetical protein
MKIVAGIAFLSLTGPALADPIAMDTPVPMGEVETVCTGIGDAKDDPRWAAYPVRVEFSNGSAQYLAGVHLTLSSGERTLASLDCPGAWVLFKLPAGKYTVSAELTGQPGGEPRKATFSTTGAGPQKRVEVQFPHLAPNE